jgi:hypothetical protein
VLSRTRRLRPCRGRVASAANDMRTHWRDARETQTLLHLRETAGATRFWPPGHNAWTMTSRRAAASATGPRSFHALARGPRPRRERWNPGCAPQSPSRSRTQSRYPEIPAHSWFAKLIGRVGHKAAPHAAKKRPPEGGLSNQRQKMAIRRPPTRYARSLFCGSPQSRAPRSR